MKALVACIAALCMLSSCSSPLLPGPAAAPDGVIDAAAPPAPASPPGDDAEGHPIIVKALATARLGDVDAAVQGTRQRIITSFDGYMYILYTPRRGRQMARTLKDLRQSRLVLSVEEDQVYRAFIVPNDSFYTGFQYSALVTDLEPAWGLTTGNASVVVAVIDTGINGQHQDLVGGRTLAGYDFVHGEALAAGINSDDHGHGTHVAGIIGAAGNNGIGIAGVAWGASLMPVKVLDDTGIGYASAIGAGIVWAVDNGARVISMSLGGRGYSPIMADAVAYAVRRGVTLVAAMGNDGGSVIEYPAAYSGVIAVGSTNGRDEIARTSTTGEHISVTAPGEHILSLSNTANNAYLYMSGTSMAAPFVAGVAALLLSQDPTLVPAEIRSIIEDSAVDLGEPGFDPVYGFGRVDARQALALPRRNNYGLIRVRVDNYSNPVSSIEALLLSGDGTRVLRTGLTAAGPSAATAGRMDFAFVRDGSYRVSVEYGSVHLAQDVEVRGAGVREVDFGYTNHLITTFGNGGGFTTDTVLTLYDSSLHQLAVNDDSLSGWYSQVAFPLQPGQTYFAKVEGYPYVSGRSVGYYSLLVNRTGTGSSSATPSPTVEEPDNEPARAREISVGVVYDRYLTENDEDWFTFTVP